VRSVVGIFVVFSLAGALARADDVPGGTPGRRAVTGAPATEPIDSGRSGEESAELRALREFEERAFRPRTEGDDPPAASEPAAPGVAPPADPDAARATLLQNVLLPDLPIRWDPKVIQYVEWFTKDARGRGVMGSWLRRAGRFEGHVRRVLAEKGLPQDLVFLAMNESGFVPTARSPVGAVGLWQFMPEAGAVYGLRQDHWLDERRDPIRSTAAGAAYLADLHARFGDWHLAMAAYNMGYNGLLRAIRKYNTNDYWVLSHAEAGLPWETTTYVPKILAAAIVGKNRERFGFGEVRPEGAWGFDAVPVTTSVDLALVARAAGVERADIVALNPQLLRGRTPPDEGTYEVRIPARRRPAFVAGMEKLGGQWRAYRRAVVRQGETVERLARRFRTTARALRELNSLADRRALPGEALVVPSVTPLPDADPAAPPVVVVPDRILPSDGRRRVLYEATSGDAVTDVARSFGVAVLDLRAWNDVTSNARLQSGQWLQLFVPAGAELANVVHIEATEARILVAGSEEFFEHHESQRGRRRIRHTVAEGETLSHLSERYGLGVSSICRINGLDPRGAIRTGQEIVVYCPVDRLPQAPPAPSDSVPVPLPVPDEPAPPAAEVSPAADPAPSEPLAATIP